MDGLIFHRVTTHPAHPRQPGQLVLIVAHLDQRSFAFFIQAAPDGVILVVGVIEVINVIAVLSPIAQVRLAVDLLAPPLQA